MLSGLVNVLASGFEWATLVRTPSSWLCGFGCSQKYVSKRLRHRIINARLIKTVLIADFLLNRAAYRETENHRRAIKTKGALKKVGKNLRDSKEIKSADIAAIKRIIRIGPN